MSRPCHLFSVFVEEKSPTLSVTKLAGVCYARSGFGEFVESETTGTLRASAAEHGVSSQDVIAQAYTVGNGQADQTKLHDVAGALNCMHDQKACIYAEPVSFENSSFGGYKQGVGTLKASGGDYGGGSENLICQPCSYNSSGTEREFVSTPIDVNNNFYVWIVRRLTPRECERLQGFPDDWTQYDTKGNEIKDTPRYKACGNSIAIPCAARVFQGIVEAERKGA